MGMTAFVRRPAVLLATAAMAASATLTGCGFGKQTLQPYQPGEGANAEAGSMALRNVLILNSGGTGQLTFTLVNTSTDATDGLVSVTAGQGIQVSGVQPVTVAPGASVTPKGITVTGVKDGMTVPVTFNFRSSGQATANVQAFSPSAFEPAK